MEVRFEAPVLSTLSQIAGRRMAVASADNEPHPVRGFEGPSLATAVAAAELASRHLSSTGSTDDDEAWRGRVQQLKHVFWTV